MNPVEVLPLLIAVFLLLSASGAEPASMEIVFEGDRTLDGDAPAFVVAGGTVTVPADATARGRLFVVGGTLDVEGRVAGDVTQLAGNLSVTEGGAITGELQAVSGTTTVAEGASVGSRTTVDVTPQQRSPATVVSFVLLQMLVVAGAAALLTRRTPELLDNVGATVTGHPLVSGVVGSLAGVTLLVLFVYMAFTLVLLPVSILGLFGQFLVVAYSYVVYGSLLGRRLPVERPTLAAALGGAGFVLLMELLSRLPLVGALVQLTLVTVGFGAVLVSYFGLRVFEPPRLPE
ncbi:polymer-forming cytoskeletal protein [Haloglomus salinum]|uniref:polymer-forming cytoskeletal protein n=1 Tax=Haloglomus salinum TaxID=2962673 RepID=UPI0020C95960|nr:polymer-forming cytoskeletal protein [Haloglomus salinum]